MNIYFLPQLNAFLNGLSTLCLVTGFVAIKKGYRILHGLAMLTAFFFSTLFLISYLYYHFHIGHIHFKGPFCIKWIYFFILTTHLILAIILLPLICYTMMPLIQLNFTKHQRIARWTLPIWLYISVTGVIVYIILYVIYPSY